jgi:Flp pilus assembly protein TadG
MAPVAVVTGGPNPGCRVHRHHRCRCRDDRGSVTLELVVLAPALLVLLVMAIVAGRYEIASGAVENASAAAARAASLARTPGQAQQDAHTAAAASLAQQRLHCADVTVTIDTTGFQARPAPGGQPGQVTATLTCQLDLAAVSVPGMPGTETIRSHTASVIDLYRSSP